MYVRIVSIYVSVNQNPSLQVQSVSSAIRKRANHVAGIVVPPGACIYHKEVNGKDAVSRLVSNVMEVMSGTAQVARVIVLHFPQPKRPYAIDNASLAFIAMHSQEFPLNWGLPAGSPVGVKMAPRQYKDLIKTNILQPTFFMVCARPCAHDSGGAAQTSDLNSLRTTNTSKEQNSTKKLALINTDLHCE